MYADVEAVLLEKEPPCTAKLFDYRTGFVRFVKIVPKEMWTGFRNTIYPDQQIPLRPDEVPYKEDDSTK